MTLPRIPPVALALAVARDTSSVPGAKPALPTRPTADQQASADRLLTGPDWYRHAVFYEVNVRSPTTFVLVYLSSRFGNESPALLSLVFYGLFGLRLAFTYERGWLLAVAVALSRTVLARRRVHAWRLCASRGRACFGDSELSGAI